MSKRNYLLAKSLLNNIKTYVGTLYLMEIIMGIKPGPKPFTKTTGEKDKRRRVTPENKSKHPELKEHEHKKGE